MLNASVAQFHGTGGPSTHAGSCSTPHFVSCQNSSGINPVAVTDCSYLVEKSSLIPLSLCPRQYPNSLLSWEACSSLCELGAGPAFHFPLWKLRLCCRTPRPSIPISSTFALCIQRGSVRVVWLILCLCLQNQCNLRAVVQEDPGSSLSWVPCAWPPPLGGRLWLCLCPCILDCGVKELSVALLGCGRFTCINLPESGLKCGRQTPFKNKGS